MTRKNLSMTVSIAFLVSGILYAESAIVINFVNNTDRLLEVSDSKARHGCTLKINKEKIAPRSSAIIEGTIHTDVDLEGSVYFNNNAERFYVHVRRLKHFGQPVFRMHADDTQTSVDSLQFNTDGIPDHLSHSAATVTVEQALSFRHAVEYLRNYQSNRDN